MYLAAQAARHLGEHLVSSFVAQGVIHILEVVQVHIQHGRRVFALLGMGDGRLQLAHQPLSIGQTGEWVVKGQKMHFCFCPLAVADVAQHQQADLRIALWQQADVYLHIHFLPVVVQQPGFVGVFRALLHQPCRVGAQHMGQQMQHGLVQQLAQGVAGQGYGGWVGVKDLAVAKEDDGLARGIGIALQPGVSVLHQLRSIQQRQVVLWHHDDGVDLPALFLCDEQGGDALIPGIHQRGLQAGTLGAGTGQAFEFALPALPVAGGKIVLRRLTEQLLHRHVKQLGIGCVGPGAAAIWPVQACHGRTDAQRHGVQEVLRCFVRKAGLCGRHGCTECRVST